MSLQLSQLVLFAAKNYREYLASVVELERKSGRGTSLRSFADRLGIGLSTFKMVLEGSRNLTVKNIHTVAKSLNLIREEHEYFENLVLRDQSDDREVWQYYNQKLGRLKLDGKTRRLRISSSTVMQNWYMPAFLIYLLDVEDINSNGFNEGCLERAAEIFKVSKASLQQAFDGLLKAGIITETPDHKYHIIFERVNGSLVKQRYLKEVFDECTKRITSEFENPLALFTAHTISLPRTSVKPFYDEYKDLLEKYMSIEGTDRSNAEILQICMQSVPMISNTKNRNRLKEANAISRRLLK